MRLVRQVLDKQLLGRERVPMGKVDGVVLVLRRGRPPRVAFIETGSATLARRLPGVLGRALAALGRRWSAKRGEPYRIPWEKVLDVGLDVEVDLVAERTEALANERWLRDHVVAHIPGA